RDLVMPRLGGLEATRRMVKEYPNVRVVIVSMHTGDGYVLEALRAGASGYVHKDSPPRKLKFAIEAVARGEIRRQLEQTDRRTSQYQRKYHPFPSGEHY